MKLKFIKACPPKRTQPDSLSRVLFQCRARAHRTITFAEILQVASGCSKSMDEIEADGIADFFDRLQFGSSTNKKEIEDSALQEMQFGSSAIEERVSATDLMMG